MSKISRVLNKLGKSKLESFSSDDVRRKIKPIFDKVNSIQNDSDYSDYLNSLPDKGGDVVDKYFTSKSLDAIANKIHYNQELDSDLKDFLDSL